MFIALSVNGAVTVPRFIVDGCMCAPHWLKVVVN